MFGGNKKKSGSTAADIETVIGKNTIFKGAISGEGNVRIDGVLEGEISSNGDVVIGERSTIKAEIKASNVFISGTVNGNITVSNKLEINSTGKLFGDVKAAILSIAEGASFRGNSQMETPQEQYPTNIEKETK